MRKPSLISRFKGAFTGFACGNILGIPVQGWRRWWIEKRFGVYAEFPDIPYWDDDLFQAVMVAEVLIKYRKISPEALSKKFLEWFNTSPHGIGRTTSIALSYMTAGLPWEEASLKAHEEMKGKSAGNGALMRSFPIGLAFDDFDTILEQNLLQTKITHWDELAAQASAVYCYFLNRLTKTSKEKAWEETLEKSKLFPRIHKRLCNALERSLEKLPTSAFCLDTLVVSIMCFLKNDDPKDTIIKCVNLGGDTDTQAALAGALAGAFWGEERIPEDWKNKIWQKERLEKLAEDLYASFAGRNR